MQSLSAAAVWLTGWLCPPDKRPAVQQAESCFTREELSAIRKEHALLALEHHSGQALDDARFLAWAGLQAAAPALRRGLCAAVRHLSHDGEGGGGASLITLDGVVVAKARLERMDRATAEDAAFAVLDEAQAGAVAPDHLREVVLGCLQLACERSASSGLEAAAAAIAEGACCSSCEGAPGPLTREGYSRLARVSPALQAALATLLANVGRSAAAAPAPGPAGPPAPPDDGGRAGPGPGSAVLAASMGGPAAGPGRLPLPRLGWGLCSPSDGLLQPGWVWLLSAGLGPALRQEWRLLFSSRRHGLSFSTLMDRAAGASPTLLVARDKGGAVFAGTAYSPWRKAGAFFGDHASLVCSLLPRSQIFPASGINDHIQFCGVGFSQLPNGLGFGGQVGHFGLWLDSTLDTGMSRPAATFASPCLASSQQFHVDAVELWLLAPPEEEAGGEAGGGGGGGSSKGLSALDKAKADRQILEWAGMGTNHSAGVRDEPLDEG